MMFWIMFLLGFCLAGKANQPSIVEKEGGTFEISGVFSVTDIGETSGGFQKLTLLGTPEESVFGGSKIKIYAIQMEDQVYTVGDQIKISGELLAFSSPTIPGGYDEKRYLSTRGFDGKMFLSESVKIGEEWTVFSIMHKGKEKISEILTSVFSEKDRGVIKALLTGDRDEIEDMTQELYRKAGITHILCISGLHISLLAMMLTILLEKVFYRSRRFSAVFTVIFSSYYIVVVFIDPLQGLYAILLEILWIV